MVLLRAWIIKPNDLTQPFVMATPSGETIQSTFWFWDIPIFLNGCELSVDVVVLEMQDFVIILGMDWLSKYHASIDCRRKSVLFRPPGVESFEFKGSLKELTIPIISALQARKMLDGGCKGFLSHNVDLSQEDTSQALGIPVMKNFLHVFPNDLPGLPLDCQIEFVIELLPGTVLVSRSPYRMAPKELK